MRRRPGRCESQQEGSSSHARAGPSPGVLLVVSSGGASVALTQSQPPLKSARRNHIPDRWHRAGEHSGSRSHVADSGVELAGGSSPTPCSRSLSTRGSPTLNESRRAARNPRKHPTAGPSPRAARWSGTSPKRTRALRIRRTPAVAIVFDMAVTKDDREIALRSVDLRAIAAAERAAEKWQPVAVEAVAGAISQGR
jgi:hypothetical protein